ncbi:MAG: hydroxymethylbilane synthase [Paracoccaceae bacterium]|nr:hydroxymethylbilane synthase [Paracoccaceae bacterium]
MALVFPSKARPLKIGTRGSPLALAQAHEVRRRLMSAFGLADECFEIVIISTQGDRVLDRPLKELGGKGLFTREIEEDLLAGAIDIAVHSMKDMPVEQPKGLVLDCFLPREDARDAFVTLDGKAFSDLPVGAVVGTSSLRRKAQLLYRRPDLKVVEFRGNVQTRLKKLKEGVAEATFLAMAGLNRLGMLSVRRAPIDADDVLPAVAQGVIGVERRANDMPVATLVEALHDKPTERRVAAERAYLEALDGSCQTPIAGYAEFVDGGLRMRGEILRTDGSEALADEITGPVEDAAKMGTALAKTLLTRAGDGFFDWR